MKRKIIALLLTSVLCIALVSCSTGKDRVEESSSVTAPNFQEFLTEEDVQKMIDNSNSSLKEEILSETTKAINTKLNSMKLSDSDKNELKQSILSSLENTLESAGTTVIQQQPDQYITNVTEQYITNEVEGTVPPEIEDGTPIPIGFDLPYTITYDTYDNGHYTVTIDRAEFYAYNHQNEPYREIAYPYEIRFIISGNITGDTINAGMMNFEPPINLILEPYGSPLMLGSFKIDHDNNTFLCESWTTLNLIPDVIKIEED